MLGLWLILALIIAVLVVVFAVQNAIPITISVLFWQFQGSLALVLLLTLALGAISGLLVSIPSLIKRNQEISGQKKKIAELQGSLTRVVEISKATQPERPEQQ
jgi:uncharacterized integral membrane protein